MENVLIFTGIPEGNYLKDFLTGFGISVVTKDDVAPVGAMVRYFTEKSYDWVVDAMPLSSVQETKDLKDALSHIGMLDKYIKLSREISATELLLREDFKNVKTYTILEDMTKELKETEGNVYFDFEDEIPYLLQDEEFKDRMIIKTVPDEKKLSALAYSELDMNKVIALNLPEDKIKSASLLKVFYEQYEIKVMALKNSVGINNLMYKLETAREAGIEVYLYDKVKKSEGVGIEEAERLICMLDYDKEEEIIAPEKILAVQENDRVVESFAAKKAEAEAKEAEAKAKAAEAMASAKDSQAAEAKARADAMAAKAELTKAEAEKMKADAAKAEAERIKAEAEAKIKAAEAVKADEKIKAAEVKTAEPKTTEKTVEAKTETKEATPKAETAATKQATAETTGGAEKQNPLVRDISVTGIGPGDDGSLTLEAFRTIKSANVIFGAKRMCDFGRRFNQTAEYYETYEPTEVAKVIREKYFGPFRICILCSGDTGFFSGANRFEELLGEEVRLVCAISSISFFSSKIKVSYENAPLLTLHGKKTDASVEFEKYGKFFAMLGAGADVERVCLYIMDDHPEAKVYVGYNLGYADEKITEFVISEYEKQDFTAQGLYVMAIVGEA